MTFKKSIGILIVTLAVCETKAFAYQQTESPSVRTRSKKGVPGPVEFITPEELKAKIAKNEPVAIIDVRATSGLAEADNKIKGAVYVKLRRLKSRLMMPPLKDVPRDREVVTYCACPNDEASIRAAEVLQSAGFSRVRVLKGGWVNWKKIKGQVEPLAKVL